MGGWVGGWVVDGGYIWRATIRIEFVLGTDQKRITKPSTKHLWLVRC